MCLDFILFPKKNYSTWTHPCSRLGYQLDHFLVFRKDLRRFRDAGSMAGQLIDSDHRALRASLDCKEPKKKKLNRDARQTLSRLDHTRLHSQEGKDLLVQHTLKVLARDLHLPIITTTVLLALSIQRQRNCCRDARALNLNGFKRMPSF